MSVETQDKLIHAIWREKRRKVESLLDSGADVNAPGSKGWTPLMQAAEMENTEIAQLLLGRGAEVNRTGQRGYTALHIAVDMSIDGTIQTGGHQGDEPTEMIELLLKNGASISAKDEDGKTALDWAIDYKSRKIVDLLRSWQEGEVARRKL
jgi:ankyrin repeat protein